MEEIIYLLQLSKNSISRSKKEKYKHSKVTNGDHDIEISKYRTGQIKMAKEIKC